MTINAEKTYASDPEAEPHRRGPLAWLGIARERAIWGVRPVRPPALPPVPRRRRPAKSSPWWARGFVGAGQPLAVVVVMLMCAPGEHHLAKLAGWEGQMFGVDLAWGMAALLAGYAGMAAFLAGKRQKGERGHRTALVGAGVALALAMAAQPVSHLFVTGWISAEPRAPWVLVVVVSCVPPLVLGHVLHLAATHPETPVPDASPDDLLTTAEVADRLGITDSAVRSRVTRGTLVPAVRDPELGNLFHPSSI